MNKKETAELIQQEPLISRLERCSESIAEITPRPLHINDMYILQTLEDAAEKLQRILNWINAYPLDIFPEPDLKKAREGLESVGITLDAVSASNMRHVLNGIKEIIDG